MEGASVRGVCAGASGKKEECEGDEEQVIAVVCVCDRCPSISHSCAFLRAVVGKLCRQRNDVACLASYGFELKGQSDDSDQKYFPALL